MSDKDLMPRTDVPSGLLSDQQVGSATAPRILLEGYTAMTAPPGGIEQEIAQVNFESDLAHLGTDPQGRAVVQAMKDIIANEDHNLGLNPALSIDPAKGIVFGAMQLTNEFGVEFATVTLTNPAAQAAYTDKLRAYEETGHTQKDAVDHDGTYDFDGKNLPYQERVRGSMTRGFTMNLDTQ